MIKLTAAQSDLLIAIAGTETGDVDAAGAPRTTYAGLIKGGLLISIPGANGSSRLLITEAGRAKIGQPTPMAPATKAKAAAPAKPRSPTGKIATLVELLRRPDGATIETMMQATGWQAHSVRGAISGSVKKTLGLEVISEKIDGIRVYRIGGEVAA